MTTTRTSHTNCDHEPTKTARARCRAGKVQQPATAMIAKTQAEATPLPMIKSIVWERETCSRCGGTGRYPSSRWQGVCLKCSGKGQMLTRAGRAAFNKYQAYLEQHHTKMMIDLEPGDITRDQHGRRRTVVSVDREIKHMGTCAIGVEGTDSYVISSSLNILVNYKREAHYVGPFSTIIVPPTGEALQAAFRHVAKMKGCIIEYAD